MGLFDKKAKKDISSEQNQPQTTQFSGLDKIVKTMLTHPNAAKASQAGKDFREAVWGILCMQAGWKGLFELAIYIANKVLLFTPIDDDHAKYAYLVFDQGLVHGVPHRFEIEDPALRNLINSLQAKLLELYLNGGDFFHQKLRANAIGDEYNNLLQAFYLQKLYVQLLQGGESLDQILSRNEVWYQDHPRVDECAWFVYSYIDKMRDNISQEDKERIFSSKWSASDPFFAIESVKDFYLQGALDETDFIPYFEEQYIKQMQ